VNLCADRGNLTTENPHAYLGEDVENRVQAETHSKEWHREAKECAKDEVKLANFREKIKKTHASEHVDDRAQLNGFEGGVVVTISEFDIGVDGYHLEPKLQK
jgi:hypothetical protein